MDTLRILAITDIHYACRAAWNPSHERADNALGLEWLVRTLQDACAQARPDVIVLLGDLVEDGTQPGAEMDLRDLSRAVHAVDLPTIVVPGNHDGDARRVLDTFHDEPGLHHVRGHALYSFVDNFDAEERCTRAREDLTAFRDTVRQQPVVALQHSPLYPEIDDPYPYLPENAGEIRAVYERANVVLSLSGHYHRGRPLTEHRGVRYHTVPALIRPPYRFEIITVTDRDATVETRRLRMPDDASVIDVHTHSHFGYCAETVHPAGTLERAHTLGLRAVACVEHAGQLYLSPEVYWSVAHINTHGVIEQARHSPDNRMGAFRNALAPYRKAGLLLGLELECDANGQLNLLDEDRPDWDILLGGVHWIPDRFPTRREADYKKSFMRCTEDLVTSGIDVLVHPFRIFSGGRWTRPSELYRPVAELLKAHKVAAEVNCHHGPPDPAFFRICAETGVRLVVGSDAHRMEQVGWLRPNFEILEQAGLGLSDLWDGTELLQRGHAHRAT
jgi:histidinol phosphatase-like PHP family hydrolase/calcineurin-like phosphoesterase family protein